MHPIRKAHPVDLNYLYARHQIALMRADAASCIEARHSHRGLATGYALAIESRRAELGGGDFATTL